jgi:hypothetical protein
MFNHINNNRIPVESAADLIRHFSTTSIIPPALILALENLPIQSRIRGLRSTDFPLWKLSCLLGEEWLHEDVLNAFAELMYFSHAAGSLEQNPDTLMLPTTFLADARYLFQQSPRLFSPELIEFRQRIQFTFIDKIYAFSCSSNHHSVYRNDPDADVIVHGDSMGFVPDPSLISIFEWLLAGTPQDIPLYIQAGKVSRQSSASGSCGLASLNFVEIDMDPTAPKWTNSDSAFFRDRALRDLVVYHLTSLAQGDEKVS